MKSQAIPIAKLSRPRLHEAIPRERLFSRLDALRKHAMIWISGPPGAGKTTLVASYMEARGIAGLWYQLDAGDADLSTYFFYLREAAMRLSQGLPLPLLTSDYAHDTAGFARRWFRQFFSGLSMPTILVFDNHQDASESQLDTVLSTITSEIPEGVTLIVMSRSAPSAVFARALAHGEMAGLGWDELRLTLEEATAVASAKGVSSPQTVNAILRQCEGWVAGLMLMVERARQMGSSSPVLDLGSMDTIFAYFAGLVFDALSDSTKRDLVLCSYLPSVSGSQAEALTGNSEAAHLLDQLYRRHLFTNRRNDSVAVYEFHALFRTFLRLQASRVLSGEQRWQALSQAAELLVASGQGSEALALFVQIEDWDSIEAAILSQAAALLAQGRGRTLRDWIALLPQNHLDRAPWVQYWLGAALVSHDQQLARGTLTRAYETLRENNDFAGQVAAASGVVETYFFSFSGYAGLQEWTQKMAQLLEQVARFSSREQRLQACSGYLLAAFFGDGTDPELPKYAEEIKHLLREPIDLNLRLRAGSFLVSYATAILHPALVSDDVELLDGLAAHAAAAPLRRAQWQIRYAYLCYQLGDFTLAEERLAIAERVCSEHGLRSPVSLLHQIGVYVATAKGDIQRAAGLMESWEQMLSADRPVERSQLNIGRLIALVASEERKNEWPSIAREISAQMDGTGQTWIRVANRIPGGYALTECGEYDSVRQWVLDVRTIVEGTCFTRHGRDVLLIEANLALHEHKPELARDRIQRALQWTLESDIPLLCAQNPRVFARLLSFACRESIEGDTARSLAARYRIPLDIADAPPRAWPIRVVTLGRFQLEIEGRAPFKGKMQQRPLALLKLLAAQGASGSAISSITAALWPDSEGDNAANALKVTLHRLRKLLGSESAITVQHAALFLDRQFCWTDVRAFEEHAELANRHRVANEMDSFERVANDALSHYQGAFLPEEEPLPWLAAARDRLAHKARQLILALGMHLEACGRTERARILYESGLAIDPLSEPLYQRLISADLRSGQYGEAMQVYRRCREMLSVVLGIPPSAETRALFEQAQTQARATPHP
jgi:DNA-binding SARP family transcriptional activator